MLQMIGLVSRGGPTQPPVGPEGTEVQTCSEDLFAPALFIQQATYQEAGAFRNSLEDGTYNQSNPAIGGLILDLQVMLMFT